MKLLFPSMGCALLLAACGGSTSGATPDATLLADASHPDASHPDAALPDAALADAAADAALADAAAPDAETPDGGLLDAGSPDSGVFEPPSYGRWVKFEPPGAVCANGSPYKFFVNFSSTSSNVIIYLEGGGACWDYASCTGTGVRTAAHRDGIPDDQATHYATFSGLPIAVDFIYPLLHFDPAVSPMADWNRVFIPYCTGDVYAGDRTVTYADPTGSGAPIEFHHVGHRNILRTIEVLATMFPAIPRMFVGGCSAGGAGALINYYFFRTGLHVDKGYLLDDSGPIFPDQAPTSRSLYLHDRVRASWNVDPLIASAPRSSELEADFGSLSHVLSAEFPNDRLAQTYFRLDYNYSLYSYERFYQVDGMGQFVTFGDGSGLGGIGLHEDLPADRAATYGLWWDDTALLRAQLDAEANQGYFMPFYRDTNSSHCLTIPGFEELPEDQVTTLFLNDFPALAWLGTEIATSSGTRTIRDFVDDLLDDAAPLRREVEDEGEGRYLSCSPDPRYFDRDLCAAAR